MNVTLNPTQFLTVYDLLTKCSLPDAKEVKSKMDLIILEALTTADSVKNDVRFTHWKKQEIEKIDALKNELKSIKPQLQDPNADGIFFRPEK